MKNIVIIFYLLLTANLFAQNKGDKLYEEFGYLTAAEFYQDLATTEQTYEVKLKLANSYRLNSEHEAAEYWYAQIINEARDPEIVLNYAQMLQANGKCEDAIRWYKTFEEQSQQDTRSFIQDCGELEKFAHRLDIELKNLTNINTEYHDFSPMLYKKGVVFTSMRREGNASTTTLDPWTKSNFSDLYYAKDKQTAFASPVALKGDINGTYHDGVATFQSVAKKMFFTRTSKEKSSQRPTKKLKIYSAKEVNGEWKETEELSFNSKEFSSCHPTLSSDGQRLYFASDQAGGFGGMDLYVSQKLGNQWSEPTNLGPTVNTAGNEIFPFIDKKDQLFFASDGHKGLGGLDIFVVEKSKTNDGNYFANRKNLGKPFNSPKDDFGFFSNEAGTKGYLSSNRPGGVGGDDIYQWAKKNPVKPTTEDSFNSNAQMTNTGTYPAPAKGQMYQIGVCDAQTGERLPDAKVALIKSGNMAYPSANELPTSILVDEMNGAYSVKVKGGQVRADASFVTDENGLFNYYLSNNELANVYIEKSRYYPVQQKLDALQFQQNEAYCIPLTPRECVLLKGKVKNKKFPKNLAGATITLVDKCTGVTNNIVSDYQGNVEFCLECNCEYDITVSKNNFQPVQKTISTLDLNCDASTVLNTLFELDLESLDPTTTPITKDYVNEYLTGSPEGNYQVGDVITLRNIYYDFDKYHIRADAQSDLNYLVSLMNNYPSMEIRLRSHTDSRGEGYYNKWLSRKRAVAAKEFLIEHGIAAYRVNGYDAAGETEIFNHCYDDVTCTEEEHQLNRRTEIVITKINQSVEILHSNYGKK